MQLNDKAPVISNHKGKTIDFQLDLSNAGHITQILRKQIYSLHDLAVAREYTTNAIDEHIKYGVTKPVQEILPSRHNSFIFSVRDYAKGLPTEDIENIYVKYGASTKRDTNTQTGCLGIGCKAAFAYTDTFNVTSYHTTGTHKYVATLTNATGQLHHLGSSDLTTSHGTGMLIEVPVPENKVSSFVGTVSKYLTYLPTELVNIQVNTNLGLENWYDVDNSDYNLMDKDNNELTYINNKHLVIEAPLGSLSIAANREELQYDDRTALTLKHLDDDVTTTVIDRVQETIDQEDTWASAIKTYSHTQEQINPEFRQGGYYTRQNLWKNIGNFTWQGEQLITTLNSCEFRYSEHIKKHSHSNAATTPYSWTHDYNGVQYGKVNDKVKLLNYEGKVAKVLLWDTETVSEHKMKQLVGYHHRRREDGHSKMQNWIVVRAGDNTDITSNTTYKDLENGLASITLNRPK